MGIEHAVLSQDDTLRIRGGNHGFLPAWSKELSAAIMPDSSRPEAEFFAVSSLSSPGSRSPNSGGLPGPEFDPKRQNCPDSHGIIALTVRRGRSRCLITCLLSWRSRAMSRVSSSKSLTSERGPSRGDDHEGIGRKDVGPGGRQCCQAAPRRRESRRVAHPSCADRSPA